MDNNFEKNYTQIGDAPKLESIYSISLYNDSGKIHHIHSVLNMEGSSSKDPDEIEKNAIAAAKNLGHNVAKLKVLHTRGVKDISGSYRVDVEKGTLVKLLKPGNLGKVTKY